MFDCYENIIMIHIKFIVNVYMETTCHVKVDKTNFNTQRERLKCLLKQWLDNIPFIVNIRYNKNE